MSEFYSEFLFRYQTDAAPRHISINAYCISEGIEYRNFIKWYRDNKKRLCESEMEEIRLSPLTVTDIPFVAPSLLRLFFLLLRIRKLMNDSAC